MKQVEQEQNMQLTQFLMGLNDSFTEIRGQILMMKPLPSLNQCYGMILQEENQCEVPVIVSGASENFTMSVKSQGSTKSQFKCSSNTTGSVKRTSDSFIMCEFCHMLGYLNNNCYCIHDYPSWHKLFGK